MKALSVRQPYASQIIRGEKQIEYRTWRTNYRGPLAIHAAKTQCPAGYPSGCIIGIVNLIETATVDMDRGLVMVADDSDLTDEQIAAIPDVFYDDCYNWILTDPREIDPIPMTGKLGLFEIPDLE